MTTTFNAAQIVAAELAKNVGTVSVNEPRSRRKMPSFGQVVFVPAAFIGFLFCGLSFGTGMFIVAYYQASPLVADMGNSWMAVVGFAMGAGFLFAIGVAGHQLSHWNSLQVSQKQVTFNNEKPKRESTGRIMVRTTNRQRRIGTYEWRQNDLYRLARRYHDDGRWVGEPRLTRKMMNGIIVNANDTYPLVVDDFFIWGWIKDKDRNGKEFTGIFFKEIREEIYPPTPG